MLAELPQPGNHQNNMCPSGLAVHHPDYETLQKYATGGCPVKTGQNWTKEEIHAAVMRGPHDSDLAEETIAHFAAEAKETLASNQARLVCFTNCGNLTQVKSIQINTGPVIFIKINSTWACSFSK